MYLTKFGPVHWLVNCSIYGKSIREQLSFMLKRGHRQEAVRQTWSFSS